jgi:hypothetical protein
VFELSEFQWFHWWPFDLLIALICINVTVATIRRIPFNVVNLGVWMIHSGIIILALGSVWYFGTKLEGDTPVPRRQIVARLPGVPEPVELVAVPGNRLQVGAYRLVVTGITPDWELLSGDDAGKLAYKVSVAVQGPSGVFIRELLAGYPQYTEDLVGSDDPNQPFQRAKKVLGTPLVDESVDLRLAYAPQEHFYLMETAAVYVRLADDESPNPWAQRPIKRLPRFKDYVSSPEYVWTQGAEPLPPLRPLDIEVPAFEDGDPIPDVTFRVSDHLRYAGIEPRRIPGGDTLNPYVKMALTDDGDGRQEIELLAFDRERNQAGEGALTFRWLTAPEQADEFRAAHPPTLSVRIPEADVTLDVPVTEVSAGRADYPFTPIDGTAWSYRVDRFDTLPHEGTVYALVQIDLKHADEAPFRRWVFDDGRMTRDVPADGSLPSTHQTESLDPRIATTYTPGKHWSLWLLGGPEADDLLLIIPELDGSVREAPITVGEKVPLRPGVDLAVEQYEPRSVMEQRPVIVPPYQRDRDVGVQASMIRLIAPDGDAGEQAEWLNYHIYPFERIEDVLRRFPYRPTRMTLADGREIELMFSRERRPLPAPVVLDDFDIESHVGGFTGQMSSIRDWYSLVRFGDGDGGAWGGVERIHMNNPTEHDGFWFFQSQWDPPDPPRFDGDIQSAGRNFTVLGVGNRNGVGTQLFGCILAVIGMIYAFYVKPYIKRRRQMKVYDEVRATRQAASQSPADLEPEPVSVSRSTS